MLFANLMKQKCSIQIEDYSVVATNYVLIGTEVYAWVNKLSNQQLVHSLRSVP